MTRRDGVSTEALALLYGFRAHAYSLAEATLDLWEHPGLQVTTPPLARATFEVGITAQWVALEPDAGLGVVGAFAQSRRKLADNLGKVPGPLADAALDVRAAIPIVTANMTGTAQSFRSICDQFVNGDELYAYYRILCGQTHAGVEMADKWIDLDEDGNPSFLAAPQTDPDPLAFLVVYGLLLAAAAFERSLDTGGTNNVMGFLDTIGDEAGLPRTLVLKRPSR